MDRLRQLPTSTFFFVFFGVLLFILGGPLQFLGVSKTGYSVFVAFLMLCAALTQTSFQKLKIPLAFIVWVLLISLNALLVGGGIQGWLYYMMLGFIPFCVFQFVTTNPVKPKQVRYFFLGVLIVQIPVLLIQLLAFDFLIQFNFSGEGIAYVDFTFGTFFVKNDVCMGYMALLYLLFYKVSPFKKGWEFLVLLLIVVLISSKLTQSLFLLLFLFRLFRESIRSLSLKVRLICLMVIAILILAILNIDYLQAQLYNLSEKKAVVLVMAGIANRIQVAVYFIRDIPWLIFGNGLTSAYNPLGSEFIIMTNFSQILWTYFDMGILGLLSFIYLAWNLFDLVASSHKARNLSFFFFMLFSYVSLSFMDASLLFMAFIFARYGLDNNSLSRLEETGTGGLSNA